MNIQFEKLDNNTGILSMTLVKEDIQGDFKKELNKLKNKGSFRGFRAGKVPAAYVRKMYGKALAQDVVLKMAQEKVNDFLKESEEKFMGVPIATEDSPELTFDDMEEGTYVFKMEIGIEPPFEISGLDKETTVTKYVVEVADEVAQEQLEKLRKSNGKHEEVSGDIQLTDVIELEVTEVMQADDKESPYMNTFSISVDKMNPKYQSNILGKDLGFEFECDIFELEEGASEKFVKKHFLKLEEEEPWIFGRVFKAAVSGITRHVDADLDEAFFERVFGDTKVSNAEEAKSEIKNIIGNSFEAQVKALMHRSLHQILMEKTDLTLPAAYVKRWINSDPEEGSEIRTDEQLQDVLKSIKWSIISTKIAEQFNVKVEREEIEESFKRQIAGMMRGYPMDDAFLSSMAQRMMGDEKSLRDTHDQLYTDKIFDAALTEVSIVEETISEEDFNNMIIALNEELKAKETNAALSSGEEE